jgi:hypothetical protein
MDTSENDSTIRLITDDAAMTDEDFGDVADDYVSDEDVLVIWGSLSWESPVTRLDEMYSGVIIAAQCDGYYNGYTGNFAFKFHVVSCAYYR